MGRFIVLIVAALLCIYLQYAECGSSSDGYTVDTPEKYEKLKQGDYNDNYTVIFVTSGAHPDVLLQPQYFIDPGFEAMHFISIGDKVNNTILVSYAYNLVSVAFNAGENPLRAIPPDFGYYTVEYADAATPTVENIDSIVTWDAQKVRIKDRGIVAAALSERGNELSKMTRLQKFDLSIHAHSYFNVNVSTFINNLPSLKWIIFESKDFTTGQLKEFEVRNPAPPAWRFWFAYDLFNYETN